MTDRKPVPHKPTHLPSRSTSFEAGRKSWTSAVPGGRNRGWREGRKGHPNLGPLPSRRSTSKQPVIIRHSTNRSMEFPGFGVVLLAQEGFATGHDYAVKSATPGGELCTGNLYA